MDIYRELILDHYKHPRNFGSLEKPTVRMEENNVTCGDRVIMDVLLEGSGESAVVAEVRFSGVGCAISQAAASLLTEKMKGMTVKAVLLLKTEDILTMLGTTLSPSRVKCATLSLEVAHKALLSLQ